MPVNSPAPGFAKIVYSVGTEEHVHNVNLIEPEPVTGGVNPVFVLPDTTSIDFASWANNYLQLVVEFYGSTMSVSRAEYWRQAEGEDPVFIYAAFPDYNTGASGAANVADAQVIFTARTQLGGVAKFQFMESIFSTAYYDVAPIANADAVALFAFITDENSIIVGRDGSRIIFPLKGIGKVSDALRKKRLGL